ncbi:mechanosensitive ion channel family protein [Haloarchaeobius sp. HME9146]|nr:mechanosensitive ion channel family protein [Haloarchaeobius sp. HME9146]MCT9096880.1 mechanosensitive ion channel family protein [Haloarchaeobius sp. HME9146]
MSRWLAQQLRTDVLVRELTSLQTSDGNIDVSALLQEPLVLAFGVIVAGVLIGMLIGKLNKRLMRAAGVPDMVEGTPFESSARSLGTSTVDIVARLSSWFIYGIAALAAVHVANIIRTDQFWLSIVWFVPDLFIAIFVLIVGFVAADKAELLTSERLRGVKLPEVNLLPRLVKYSVIYIAFLVALSQVGVNMLALVVLLAAYLFALIFLGGLAFRDFLRASAAGMYLLLRQPYGIGDQVEVDDKQGVVQEVDLFVTQIEADGSEYIVPNNRVFENGVVRIRE